MSFQKGGFFIECGGYDGETFSNTLYMERSLNWTGLLVEASPKNFNKLLEKNRKSWISNTCLSVTPYPEMVGNFVFIGRREMQGEFSLYKVPPPPHTGHSVALHGKRWQILEKT